MRIIYHLTRQDKSEGRKVGVVKQKDTDQKVEGPTHKIKEKEAIINQSIIEGNELQEETHSKYDTERLLWYIA